MLKKIKRLPPLPLPKTKNNKHQQHSFKIWRFHYCENKRKNFNKKPTQERNWKSFFFFFFFEFYGFEMQLKNKGVSWRKMKKTTQHGFFCFENHSEFVYFFSAGGRKSVSFDAFSFDCSSCISNVQIARLLPIGKQKCKWKTTKFIYTKYLFMNWCTRFGDNIHIQLKGRTKFVDKIRFWSQFSIESLRAKTLTIRLQSVDYLLRGGVLFLDERNKQMAIYVAKRRHGQTMGHTSVNTCGHRLIILVHRSGNTK